jgi:predicted enzyme related to lactoylglutathione lyase
MALVSKRSAGTATARLHHLRDQLALVVEQAVWRRRVDVGDDVANLNLWLPQEECPMAQSAKPRVVGFNHVAFEVGDIEEALAFYGRLFEFELRGKSDTMAFIDLGDQFIALQKGRKQPPDDGRHFGLVVDDKEAARAALKIAGITPLEGPFVIPRAILTP